MNGQIVKETVFVTLYFTTRLMGAGETTLGDKDSETARNTVGQKTAICVPAAC